ncbi:LacI family transcriptional regulator [Grimontia sp. AD028]|uniref:LacI family DNA-binding transcriptional regulator n=1 Tax=Grimontia sp. AD028 TaxID=1581149 RepID=UPI00061B3169|nr:LacI family DNA-binding transcriptional regulator [Grimontia sp. AD028]KKD60826.1 LacI family transcriptional regulator [Grimontia sp. AD028]
MTFNPRVSAVGRGLREKRPTINELSKALGLSKGTVSRALNDYPDISPITKQRVREKAKEMGYRALSYAQAIKTGQVCAIGLVLNLGSDNAHRPFLTNFIDGISRAVSRHNWTLTVATANGEKDELQTLRRLIDEHKVDGFILPRSKAHDPRIALLKEEGVPFVIFGRSQDLDNVSFFDIRGEAAMRESVQILARRGHKRIAFVNGGDEYNYSHLREDGFRQGMQLSGLEVDESLMLCGGITKAAGQRLGGVLLSQSEPPTAVVCALDIAALGIYRAASERGIEIGKNLAVIGYDGLPESEFASPPLTTFSVDMRYSGEQLATLLLRQINGERPEDLRKLVNAQLIKRLSHGIKQ